VDGPWRLSKRHRTRLGRDQRTVPTGSLARQSFTPSSLLPRRRSLRFLPRLPLLRLPRLRLRELLEARRREERPSDQRDIAESVLLIAEWYAFYARNTLRMDGLDQAMAALARRSAGQRVRLVSVVGIFRQLRQVPIGGVVGI
jgi:hypothetical protein